MKRLCALVIVCSLLAGCATQGDTARTEGTAAGAAIGALVGAGLGYAVGRDATAAGIGAGVGALLGGAGGYAYADRVAKRHAALAGKENDLNARIAFARGVNEDTEQYNERLKRDVNQLEPQVAALEARKAGQQITQVELQRQRQQVGVKLQDANKQLAAGQAELEDLKKFRATRAQSSKPLDDEINKLEASLDQVKASTTTLASMSQRL